MKKLLIYASIITMGIGGFAGNVYAAENTEETIIVDSYKDKDAEGIMDVFITDSTGKYVKGVKVQITAVLGNGDVRNYTENTRGWQDWEKICNRWPSDVGGMVPDAWILINKFKKATYTIHFQSVPQGYVLPKDVKVSIEKTGYTYNVKIVDSGDVVIEIDNNGIAKINLRKTGDSIEVTRWMREKPVSYFDNTYTYYCGSDGRRYTGWKYMDAEEGEKNPHWSYFSEIYGGYMYTGWRYMNSEEGETTPHWSYFGSDGSLVTGWKYLTKKDGEKIPHWSYFGNNGWLRTGWQYLGNSEGEKTPHWSYFGGNGWLRTGWQQMGQGTPNPDGKTARHWSYFGSNGWLRTGIQQMGKGTNNPDGKTATHKSYFGNNGWLVTNKKFSVAGKTYTADSRGWLK